METFGNNLETTAMSQMLKVSTSEKTAFDTHLTEEQKKNARELMQLAHARKSHYLIVDEEWW